jgi:hypothetical protein
MHGQQNFESFTQEFVFCLKLIDKWLNQLRHDQILNLSLLGDKLLPTFDVLYILHTAFVHVYLNNATIKIKTFTNMALKRAT